jgi:site-specific DNA-adenine methylase
MKSPFPYFGGKSKVADAVWAAFGDVPNYIEPFFGSGAVLLNRPDSNKTKIETVNDIDGFLSNFWRAVKFDPESVAAYADYPVNENDLFARHSWLVNRRKELTEKLEGDPDFYDAKFAGWWVWGICAWIGGGWCSGQGPWFTENGAVGINRQLPHLGSAGRGINGVSADRYQSILNLFVKLSDRLRSVRVCCGDWNRIMGKSILQVYSPVGIFLDPPYSSAANRANRIYAKDDFDVANDVRMWCIENGDNPTLRIALCGYEGEHGMPESWKCFQWKAVGGYGSQGKGQGRENAIRERIWFSQACIPIDGVPQGVLF